MPGGHFLYFPFTLQVLTSFLLWVMIVFLIFSIHTAGPDELSAGGDDRVSYIFHSHCRSWQSFCWGWWWCFLYFPFTLQVLTSFLLGVMVFLSFPIHTAGPDELFAVGDDRVSYIFHLHCRSWRAFCWGGWWSHFLYFPFTLQVLTSFLLGVVMVFLSFSIHTAGPDELFAVGDDRVSYIFHLHCRSWQAFCWGVMMTFLLYFPFTLQVPRNFLLWVMMAFLIFSIHTEGSDKLFAGGWDDRVSYIFHLHCRSWWAFCWG